MQPTDELLPVQPAVSRPAGPMARRTASAAAPRRAVRLGLRAGGLALVALVLGSRFFVGSGTPVAGAGGGHPGTAAGASAAPVFVAAQADPAPAAPAATATEPAPLASGGMRFDYVDVALKAGLVIVLLVITLRVMRRLQAGPRDASALLTVVESRGVGPKAQVLLLAVGDRRLVVGLTPAGMTTLADLSADALAAGALAAATSTGSAATESSATPPLRTTIPAILGVPAVPAAVSARLASFAGTLRAATRPGRGSSL